MSSTRARIPKKRSTVPWIFSMATFAALAFVPTPLELYKGSMFLGYVPVWLCYAGLTMWDWSWAFWWSCLVVAAHLAVTVAIFLLVRRVQNPTPA